jgi:DNA-binding IclR family transcriptional regulator
MTISQLGKTTGIARASLTRLIADLVDQNVVRFEADPPRYQLGLRLWNYGVSAIKEKRVRDVAWPHLAGLAKDVQNFVNLACAEGDEVVIVETINATGDALSSSFLYRRAPLVESLSGRVIAAYRASWRTNGAVLAVPDGTPETIRAEIEKIRASGYGCAESAEPSGVSNIAVPIFDRSCDAVAAISMPRFGPLPPEFIGRILPRALEVSRRVSAELGYDPAHAAPLA